LEEVTAQRKELRAKVWVENQGLLRLKERRLCAALIDGVRARLGPENHAIITRSSPEVEEVLLLCLQVNHPRSL